MEEMKLPEPQVTDRNETPKTSAARKRPTFQGEQWAERHYPGCRFALPWAMSRLPFQGVLHLRGARLWSKRAQGQVPLIRKNDNIKE